MNSRLILNISLISIVGILVLITIYQPGEVKNTKHPLISDFDANNIKSIILQRNGSVALQLLKEQSSWFISKPFITPANNFQVNALLAIATNHSYSQFDAKQHDLKKFGLMQPHISLQLNNQQLHFGGTDPLSFRRYVLVNNTIHLINNGSYPYLSQDITKFVSNKLLPDKKTISKIQLPNLKLTKDSNNGSWVIEPEDNSLSADDINKFIAGWQSVHANSVSPWPANLAATGELKATNENSITIRFNDDSQLQLFIIDDKTDLIVGRTGLYIQYVISKSDKNKLFNLKKS